MRSRLQRGNQSSSKAVRGKGGPSPLPPVRESEQSAPPAPPSCSSLAASEAVQDVNAFAEAQDEPRRTQEQPDVPLESTSSDMPSPFSHASPPRPPEPLRLPVLVFMWLRDRAPAAGRNVQPSLDRKHVIIPDATTQLLFDGHLVLAAIHGYLPRSDDVRLLQRSIKAPSGAVGSQTSPLAAATVGRSPPRAPMGDATHHNHHPSATATPQSKRTHHLASVQPPTQEELRQRRLDVWSLIRSSCRSIGVEMSEVLVRDIAESCDHDALGMFLDGLYQSLKRYDVARREYSKALVAEAAAGNPTKAAEVHREPPPAQVMLVARRQLVPVVVETNTFYLGYPGDGGGASHEPVTVPPPRDQHPPSESSAEASLANTAQQTPQADANAAQAADEPQPPGHSDVGSQTEGRVLVILSEDVFRDAAVQCDSSSCCCHEEDGPIPAAMEAAAAAAGDTTCDESTRERRVRFAGSPTESTPD